MPSLLKEDSALYNSVLRSAKERLPRTCRAEGNMKITSNNMTRSAITLLKKTALIILKKTAIIIQKKNSFLTHTKPYMLYQSEDEAKGKGS